jgi:hypothetical protein
VVSSVYRERNQHKTQWHQVTRWFQLHPKVLKGYQDRRDSNGVLGTVGYTKEKLHSLPHYKTLLA